MMRLILVCAAILAALTLPVASQEPGYSPYFKTLAKSLPDDAYQAFEGWETPLRAHLKQIMATVDDPESIESAEDMLALTNAPRIDFDNEDELIGNWRARSLQSDSLGAFAYPWFPARIYREGEALVFDKDSGSQRHRGLMAQASADTVFFAGALYYGYQDPRLHSAHMEPGSDADPAYDATAILYKLGPERYLMVFRFAAGRFRFYEIAK